MVLDQSAVTVSKTNWMASRNMAFLVGQIRYSSFSRTPHVSASVLACALSPSAARTSGAGPTKVRPAAWQALLEGWANPIYVAFHAVSLLALVWFALRLFRVFPGLNGAHGNKGFALVYLVNDSG